MHMSLVVRHLAILSALVVVVFSYTGRAQATPTIFTNLESLQAGNIPDGEALEALETVLRSLDAMPTSGGPTVVQIQSVDSRYASSANASAASRLKDQTDLIVSALERHGGPESIFVATQWGTSENRMAEGQMMGRDAPFFPTTGEELVASGLAWLADPEGFALRWDGDGALAEIAATRNRVRGMEFLGPVRMVLCVDDQHVLAWARSQRESRPTEAALGRFVQACVDGEYTGLSADYRLPVEVVATYGVDETWFAVLLLDAYTQPVPVSQVADAAQMILEAASVSIPLFLAGGETLTADFEEIVPAGEHRAALLDLGVKVDPAFSDSLPNWVYGFSTHPASTLVIFDDSGRAVAFFAASPSNPTSVQTLQQWMTLNGFF